MSQGLEHVEAALKLVESACDRIGELGGVDDSWRAEAVSRLASVTDLLRATTDRFFLKTKVCLPFARRCEDEAKALDALLVPLAAQPGVDGQGQVDGAVEAVERAAKTLDERSQMRGMTIT